MSRVLRVIRIRRAGTYAGRFTASRAVAVIKPLISSRAANEVIFSNYVSRCQNVVMSGQKAGLCGWALFRASRRGVRCGAARACVSHVAIVASVC